MKNTSLKLLAVSISIPLIIAALLLGRNKKDNLLNRMEDGSKDPDILSFYQDDLAGIESLTRGSVNIKSANIDLNDDGTHEIIVVIRSPLHSGSHGDYLGILSAANGSFDVLDQMTLALYTQELVPAGAIYMLETTNQGYHDLQIFSGEISFILQYEDGKYQYSEQTETIIPSADYVQEEDGKIQEAIPTESHDSTEDDLWDTWKNHLWNWYNVDLVDEQTHQYFPEALTLSILRAESLERFIDEYACRDSLVCEVADGNIIYRFATDDPLVESTIESIISEKIETHYFKIYYCDFLPGGELELVLIESLEKYYGFNIKIYSRHYDEFALEHNLIHDNYQLQERFQADYSRLIKFENRYYVTFLPQHNLLNDFYAYSRTDLGEFIDLYTHAGGARFILKSIYAASKNIALIRNGDNYFNASGYRFVTHYLSIESPLKGANTNNINSKLRDLAYSAEGNRNNSSAAERNRFSYEFQRDIYIHFCNDKYLSLAVSFPLGATNQKYSRPYTINIASGDLATIDDFIAIDDDLVDLILNGNVLIGRIEFETAIAEHEHIYNYYNEIVKEWDTEFVYLFLNEMMTHPLEDHEQWAFFYLHEEGIGMRILHGDRYYTFIIPKDSIMDNISVKWWQVKFMPRIIAPKNLNEEGC